MKLSENYILEQSEPYRGILLHLQSVIEKTVPEMDLKFKYNIPFNYFNNRPFCYLNQSKNYVEVGFWNAAHYIVHLEKMTTDGRKVMRSLRYNKLEEIDDSVVIEVLQNAYQMREKKYWK